MCSIMVMKPGKHQRRKQRCQDLCWKVHDRVQSFFGGHKLYINYVTETFLLVSSSVSSKQLCVLCTVNGKNVNKNIQQRTLLSFITILLLPMVCTSSSFQNARIMQIQF